MNFNATATPSNGGLENTQPNDCIRMLWSHHGQVVCVTDALDYHRQSEISHRGPFDRKNPCSRCVNW